MPVLEHLENEYFLGRRCIAGDDGRLTWLVIASGYKTVHQSTAKAISMFPSSFKAFVKQRVRWSRNSYRTYLTAATKGWLWRTPFVTKVTVLQILLTPLTMGMTLTYLVISRFEVSTTGGVVVLCWLLLGRGIRGWSNLRRNPVDIFFLPILALTVILIALPVKLFAFFTMNKQGWLTRSATQIGGEGQTAKTPQPRGGGIMRRALAVGTVTVVTLLLAVPAASASTADPSQPGAGSVAEPVVGASAAPSARPTRDTDVPAPGTYAGDPVAEAELVAQEDRRLIDVNLVSKGILVPELDVTHPFRVTGTAVSTLVLTPRAAPYTLDEIATLAPTSVVKGKDGVYDLNESIAILKGATLDIHSRGAFELAHGVAAGGLRVHRVARRHARGARHLRRIRRRSRVGTRSTARRTPRRPTAAPTFARWAARCRSPTPTSRTSGSGAATPEESR